MALCQTLQPLEGQLEWTAVHSTAHASPACLVAYGSRRKQLVMWQHVQNHPCNLLFCLGCVQLLWLLTDSIYSVDVALDVKTFEHSVVYLLATS